MPTYSIELWDHDLEDFSGQLARIHLGGPSDGLTLPQVGRALRQLRQHWSDESILVQRVEVA